MKAHPDEALAALKPYFPDTDEATLKLSLDATIPAMSEHGKLTEAAVSNQLTVLKSIGAIKTIPSAAKGVLWTDAVQFRALSLVAERAGWSCRGACVRRGGFALQDKYGPRESERPRPLGMHRS